MVNLGVNSGDNLGDNSGDNLGHDFGRHNFGHDFGHDFRHDFRHDFGHDFRHDFGHSHTYLYKSMNKISLVDFRPEKRPMETLWKCAQTLAKMILMTKPTKMQLKTLTLKTHLLALWAVQRIFLNSFAYQEVSKFFIQSPKLMQLYPHKK